MIWALLAALILLMAAPFVISWYYTGKTKRTILDIPSETSDVPRHKIAEIKPEDIGAEMMESLDAPEGSGFEKPLWVAGMARFGAGTKLNVCHADRMVLSEQCTALSFLDADSYLSAGQGCALLESAECGGDMDIAAECTFHDLFAREIRFSGGAVVDTEENIAAYQGMSKPDGISHNISQIDDEATIERSVITRRRLHVGKNAVVRGDIFAVIGVSMDEGASIGGNIISHHGVTIGEKCRIVGDISVEGNIALKDGAVVFGNVISQKAVIIGSNCRVYGNVFAQEGVELDSGTIIGTKGKIKSVIAGDTACICGNCTVYGRVRSIRGGKTKAKR